AFAQRPIPIGVTPAPHVVSPVLPASPITPPSFGGAPPAPVEPPAPEPPAPVVTGPPVVCVPVVCVPVVPGPVVLVPPPAPVGPVNVPVPAFVPVPWPVVPLVAVDPPVLVGRPPPELPESEQAPAMTTRAGMDHPNARKMEEEDRVDMGRGPSSRATTVQRDMPEKAGIFGQIDGSTRS